MHNISWTILLYLDWIQVPLWSSNMANACLYYLLTLRGYSSQGVSTTQCQAIWGLRLPPITTAGSKLLSEQKYDKCSINPLSFIAIVC